MSAPNKEELELLTKFREMLKDLELEGDRNSDMFLLRWIRARDNKLDLSEDMLRKSLKWRKENDTDNVLSWAPPSTILDLLPMDTLGWDKSNNPVVIFPIGRWDLRAAVDSGRKDDCVRYISKIWETLLQQMKDRKTKEGVPITQFTAIVDMDELGMKTVGSMTVLQAMKEIVSQFESNYPEILYQAYIINASRIFQILWGILSPLFTQRTTSKIQILTSAPKWKPILLQAIAPDELPQFYGGARDSKLHPFLKHTMRMESDENLQEITIAAGQTMEIPVPVEKGTLTWKFTLENYDIDFYITFNGKEVVAKERVDAQKGSVSGSHKCKSPGNYTLHFDNSYSRMRSKTLSYVANVETKKGSVKK